MGQALQEEKGVRVFGTGRHAVAPAATATSRQTGIDRGQEQVQGLGGYRGTVWRDSVRDTQEQAGGRETGGTL